MTLTANDCPSCQQLQRELAAALQRAERAEEDRDGVQMELQLLQVVNESTETDREFQYRKRQEAEADLAAARGERDRLQMVARGLEKDLRNAQLPWFAERLRAALWQIEAYPAKVCPMIDAATQCIHGGQCEVIVGMWGIAHAALGAASEENTSLDKARLWFGEHVWAEDDFGGIDPQKLAELFDVLLPDWRAWTWAARRAAGERSDDA